MTVTRIPPIERLMGRTIKAENGCWLYQGARQTSGHGTINVGYKKEGTKRPVGAHRLSWEHHNGPIPKGLFVLHKCDVPNCVNPEHLFLGTQADNMDDKVKKGRQPRGERAGGVKLYASMVEWIAAAPSEVSQRKLAKFLGISQPTISNIQSGKRWVHLTFVSRAG